MAKSKPPVARIEETPAEPETMREEASAADESAAAPKAAQPKKAQAKAKAARTKAPEPAAESEADGRTGLTGLVAQVFPGHEHAVIGGIAGLLVAVLFFLLGFWRTVLVCLLVFCGVAIGQYLDGDPRIVNLVRRALGDGRGGN